MFAQCLTINSAIDLDAAIGMHVTREEPEVFWEDSHGQFQFESEDEVRRAVMDPYFQRFLPEVDWSRTLVREVRMYRACSADPALIWNVVDKASQQEGPLSLRREHGKWRAAFGSHLPAEARTAPVAICLAALQSKGFMLDVNHDRIDAQVSQYKLQMQPAPTEHLN